MQNILVDGYNVLFADDGMRRAVLRNRQEGRQRLVDLMRQYVSVRNVQVTIVFDGRGRMVDAEAVVRGRLQVIYSPQGQTADELILDTLRESGRPRSYVVVTSDRHIVGAARGMGSQTIGAKTFLDQVSLADDPSPTPPAEEKPQPDAADVDFWISRFEEDET